jgi:hypothetical protein
VCTQEQFSKLLTVFVNGLSNYTNDQRGDVGSWVRTSSLKSLDQIIDLYTKSPESIEARKNSHNIHFDGRAPLELDIHGKALESSQAHENTHKIHHDRMTPLKLDQRFLISHIFSGALRQSLDSIDSVRQLAWQTMSKILVYLSSSKLLLIENDIVVLLQSAFDQFSRLIFSAPYCSLTFFIWALPGIAFRLF